MVDRGSNGPHLSPRPTDFTVTDRRSSGLQRNAEVGNTQKLWENRPKTCFTQENSRLRSRESSTDLNNSEQNRDNMGKKSGTSHPLNHYKNKHPWELEKHFKKRSADQQEVTSFFNATANAEKFNVKEKLAIAL